MQLSFFRRWKGGWIGHATDFGSSPEERQGQSQTAQGRVHPWGDRCKHGTSFLDECESCPGGNPVVSEEHEQWEEKVAELP